jgi:hypothetical protein
MYFAERILVVVANGGAVAEKMRGCSCDFAAEGFYLAGLCGSS